MYRVEIVFIIKVLHHLRSRNFKWNQSMIGQAYNAKLAKKLKLLFGFNTFEKDMLSYR